LFGPSLLALKKTLKMLLRELTALVSKQETMLVGLFKKDLDVVATAEVCLATLLSKALPLKKDFLL
jgi:hypothetical protein